MQREHNRPLATRDNDEDVQHLTLSGLLAPTDVLVLYRPLGTASLLTQHNEQEQTYLVAQEQFTNNEMRVLLPLLTNYPYHCPYEVLYAGLYYNRISDQSVERARKTLREAKRLAEGENMEMHQVRNVLSRTRLKLRRLGIDVISMIETGYMLFPYAVKETTQEDTPA